MSVASCRRNQRAMRLQDALEAAKSAESAILRMARVNSNYLPKVRLAGKIEEMKWKKTDCTEGKEAFEASTF